MSDTDFDVNAWESGKNSHAQGEDFDVFKYEGAGKPETITPENAPPVPKPAIQMAASNIATALNPTESVATPGEGAFVAQADPKSRVNMLMASGVGAGGAGAVELGPEAVAALTAAAKSHPLVAHIIKTGITGLVGGAAFAKGSKLAKLLAE